MPRTARIAPGAPVVHVLNRRVDRRTLFHSDADYVAFEELPDDWTDYGNRIETSAELEALRKCVVRETPYGTERLRKRTSGVYKIVPLG